MHSRHTVCALLWTETGDGWTKVYVEPLWRSLKQEEVYLHAYETVVEAEKYIAEHPRYFNEEHTHQGA